MGSRTRRSLLKAQHPRQLGAVMDYKCEASDQQVTDSPVPTEMACPKCHRSVAVDQDAPDAPPTIRPHQYLVKGAR